MKDPIILSGDEVIDMDRGRKFTGPKLLKFSDINKSIKGYIESNFPNYRGWTVEGIRAKILQPGKDWQKGTLKLVVSYRVEFIPDAVPPSQSPLDDLRSQLNPE